MLRRLPVPSTLATLSYWLGAAGESMAHPEGGVAGGHQLMALLMLTGKFFLKGRSRWCSSLAAIPHQFF